MANTVENTFKKVGNVLEQIFGTASTQQPISNTSNNGGKQTCLEKMGIEARQYHLLREERMEGEVKQGGVESVKKKWVGEKSQK